MLLGEVIVQMNLSSLKVDQKKLNEITDIIHKFKKLSESLKECESETIFRRVADTSSNMLFELIQNADDAAAKEIVFNIVDDKLIVSNDGVAFTAKDVSKLCGVNDTKGEKYIGRFGIGFKSVYTVANRVDLYSGGYYIKINDYIGIEIITEGYKELCNNKTSFILYLKSSGLKDIENKIKAFQTESFIFLNNIERIRIDKDNKNVFKWEKIKESYEDCYYEKEEPGKLIRYSDIVTIREATQEVEQKFLIFKSQKDSDKSQKDYLKIAFKINKEANIVRHNEDFQTTLLYAFFPLKINTKQNFLISANFNINTSRNNLELSENANLLMKLTDFASESIIILANKGLKFDYRLFILENNLKFNVNEEVSENLYKKLAVNFTNVLIKEPVLLCNDGKYHTSNEVLKIAEKRYELKSLFSTDEIMPGEKEYFWLSNEVERLIDNSEIDQSFIKKFKTFEKNNLLEFLKQGELIVRERENSWLINFYKFLFNSNDLSEALFYKLYKTQSNEFLPIKESHDIHNIFLSISENVKSKMPDDFKIELLNENIINDDELENIIVKRKIIFEFTFKNVIENILSTSEKTLFNEEKKIVHDEYFKMLPNILKYSNLSKKMNVGYENLKLLLIDKLPIVQCMDLTGYLQSNQIKYYYLYHKKSLFYDIDNKIFRLFKRKNENKSNLNRLDINTSGDNEKYYLINDQKYKEKLDDLSYRNWQELMGDLGIRLNTILNDKISFTYQYNFSLSENIKKFKEIPSPEQYWNRSEIYMPSILYISTILKDITLENSIEVWNLIADNYSKLTKTPKLTYYYAKKSGEVELTSEFFHILKTTQWLFNKAGSRILPSEAKHEDLKQLGYRASVQLSKFLEVSLVNKSSKYIKAENSINEIKDIDEIESLIELLIKKKKL